MKTLYEVLRLFPNVFFTSLYMIYPNLLNTWDRLENNLTGW